MIYFVAAKEVGLIKIGFTNGPVEERLSELQCGSPVKLELLLTVEGGRALEAQLHARFAQARARGEWFRAVPELKAHIEVLAHEEASQIWTHYRALAPGDAWERTVLVSPDGGLYVPAAASGVSERRVWWCCVGDGRPVVTELGHYYVPADWLEREYPDAAEFCRLVRERIAAHREPSSENQP